MPPLLEYSHAVTTGPVIEPVSVEEAKRNSDEDDSHRDSDFALWIKEARERVEDESSRALITQTHTLTLDRFPDVDYINLPRPPLASVSSIQYVDDDGNTQTFSSSDYTVDTNRSPGCVFLNYNESWPTTRSQRNAVTITYVCGYGSSADDVPAEARSAIRLFVKHRYDMPERSDAPPGFDELVSRLRWGFYP